MEKMKVRLERREDGLSVVIPAELAELAELEAGSEAEMRVVAGAVEIFRPGSRPTLQELLDGITEENRHPEVWTGPPVGREVW